MGPSPGLNPVIRLFVPGSAQASQFLGSVSQSEGENRACSEFTVVDGYDAAKIDEAKQALRTTFEGYSDSRCDTTGAIGYCSLRQTQNGVTMDSVLYFFGSDPTRTKDICQDNQGTWHSL